MKASCLSVSFFFFVNEIKKAGIKEQNLFQDVFVVEKNMTVNKL